MLSLLSKAPTVTARAAVSTVSSLQVDRASSSSLRNREPYVMKRSKKLPVPGTGFRKLWRTEKKPTKKQLLGPLKIRGLLCPDSTFVTRGEKLVNQIGTLYLPGLNVRMKPSFTLVAMEHGRVFVTTEKLEPNWDHVFAQHFYSAYKDTDIPIYKTYVHVIPAPMPQTFNLVDQF